MAVIEPWLLEVIACPKCRARVVPDPVAQRLNCPACRVAYPIVDGIPQMLPESAVPLSATGAESPA